jgi:hypothetical protein
MSQFLSNLMARSFADVPAIQPRLPSLFEPGDAGPMTESRTFSEPALENQTSPSTNAVARPSQKISRPSNPAVAVTSPSQAHFSPSDSDLETETANLPTSQSRDQHPPVPRTQVTKHFSDQKRLAGGQTFPQRLDQTSTTNTPTINVTIGRVEVRAIHSPAPVRKQSKPAAPKLSLEDYLKKREGGAR